MTQISARGFLSHRRLPGIAAALLHACGLVSHSRCGAWLISGGVTERGWWWSPQLSAFNRRLQNCCWVQFRDKEIKTSPGRPCPSSWTAHANKCPPPHPAVQEDAQPAGVPELQLQLHGDPGRPHLLLQWLQGLHRRDGLPASPSGER